MPPRHDSVTVSDIRFHVVEWGERTRQPLVLLHGGSAHCRWWDFFAVPLARQYRPIAVDLRGHGDSGWAGDSSYQIEAYARDVVGLFRALNLSNVILVGHSLGGLVAGASAPLLEACLSGLVLIDTACRLTEHGARYMNALSRFAHPVYPSLEEAVRRFRLLPTANGANPEVLAHVARHAVTQLHDGTWTLKFDRRALARIEPCDVLPSLGSLRCPILIIRGGNSSYFPAKTLSALGRSIPKARTLEIPGAHHHVMLDAPGPLADAVRAFADE